MRVRTLFLCGSLVLVVAALVYAATIRDATKGIREHYPSARVAVHQGHSDPRFVLGFIRMIRGRGFVPAGEWLDVSIAREPVPIDLPLLQQLRVTFLDLRECKVQDLTGLKSFGYVVFSHCDLSALSPERVAELQARRDDPETLVYGGP